jgi:uncharacterized membrane protein
MSGGRVRGTHAAGGAGAYFLGPAATDILSHIGVRGVIAIVIIAAVGLLYRYLWHRRNPPETGVRTPEDA